MAERTAEGGVRLSLILDQNGTPFVRQVSSAADQATGAISRAGARAGRSFGEVLGSGFVIKAAAATIVLRRLTSAAGDASPEFKALKRDAGEAASAIGGDLQRAIGSTLSVAGPFLDWLTSAGGATRGLVAGLLGGTAAANVFKTALTALGLSGGAATAVILGLGAALGALSGLVADKARTAQEEFDGVVQDALAKGRGYAEDQLAATEESLRAQEELLIEKQGKIAQLNRDLLEEQANVQGAAKGVRGAVGGVAADEKRRLEADVREIQGRIDELTPKAAALKNAMALFNQGRATVAIDELPISDFIAKQQLAIASGVKSLDEARSAVKIRRAEVEKELELLRDSERAFQPGAESLAVFTRLAGGDRAKGIELQNQAKDLLTRKRLIAQVEKESDSLLTAQLDLTTRIGDQSERARTTELNRKVLQAQLVDGLRGFGPVLEKQVLEEERRRLAVEEGGRAKTRILELDNEILNLSGQIAEVERKRAELSKQESAAKWREEVTAFQAAYLQNVQVEMALAKLAAASDEQYRRQRISALQQELGLRSLTVAALEDELAAINASAAAAPEQAAQRRQQLGDLIGLLQEEKQTVAENSAEVQLLGDAFGRMANQAALALVQTVTRGKAEIKDLADFALRTFEEMFAQLLARQVVLTFLSLFTGGGGAAAGAGAGIPIPVDFGGSITRLGPRPNYPQIPSAGLMQASSAGRIEERVGQLAAAVQGLTLKVGTFELRGADLRASVQIAEGKTPKLRTA